MIYRKALFENLSLLPLLLSLLIAQLVAAEDVLPLSIFFEQRYAVNELSELIKRVVIRIRDYLLNVLPLDLFILVVNGRCENLILAVHPLHVLLQLNHAL